jgi:NADPH-dependent glutamate synthase beta subunit-like oxidoreductase/coenzyme F420-reducing hydrogenase delta subunit/ferredoxin
VNTDTRRYVDAIARGCYEEALDLLLAANPFTSVCGRICNHPCEQACRRSKVDGAIGLRALKRFVVENTGEYRRSRRPGAAPSHPERIAIIGAGPAGLTAAHDLARQGYRVTVFERSATPGGMLGATIPRYRLPYEVVKQDIDDILALGVELRTGVAVGTDVTLEDLRQQGFSAVLLATGLSESHTLGIPGIDSEGVLLALPFLRAVRAGAAPALGQRTVVVGGGNVAIDVARSARRLGVAEVALVCLESREEMPASPWEIEEAIEEGIRIMPSWGPQMVLAEGGKVSGVALKRCVRVFDEGGRFAPVFDEHDFSTLPADTAVLAIGQRADLTCLQGSEVREARPGRLECDPATLATSEPGVFACGEVARGPGAAVDAVADGHRAAQALAHYLRTGELMQLEAPAPATLGDLPKGVAEKVRRVSPIEVRHLAPDVRTAGFAEFEHPYTEAEALAEARRCMACTVGAFVDEERCAGCLNCVRICPFGVATVEKTAVMPEEACQACGLCAAECPAAAVALQRFGTNQMRDQLADLLAQVPEHQRVRPLIVSYCCLFEATSRAYTRTHAEDLTETGILRVMVPCVARLSLPDMLGPLELGADAVVIISCAEGECMYPTAEDRLARRVRRAKAFLDEIGLGAERLDHWRTQGSAEVSWAAFWELSRRKLLAVMAHEESGVAK